MVGDDLVGPILFEEVPVSKALVASDSFEALVERVDLKFRVGRQIAEGEESKTRKSRGVEGRQPGGQCTSPIVANGIYLGVNVLFVHDRDDIGGHETLGVHRDVSGLVCAAIPKKIRSEDPIVPLHEEINLVTPALECVRGKSMEKQDGRLARSGWAVEIAVSDATGRNTGSI